MNQKEKILQDLEPLFLKAEREGLMFYTSYQNLLFTPKQLRDMHKENRFIWGAVNWQLRKQL